MNSRHLTKNRIVAVDIVRLIAAFAVMFEHLQWVGGGTISKYIAGFPIILCELSPLFFVLAGYFVCRNITWKKAFNNSWWCFAPFLLWNTITFLIRSTTGNLPEGYTFLDSLGMKSIFIENWSFLGNYPAPADGPLWFMRDLIFLFLLSPLMARSSVIIFPLCVLASLVPDLAPFFANTTYCSVISPRSIAFFSAGCLLQTFSREQQQKALTFYSPAFIVSYLAIMCIDFKFFKMLTGYHPLYLSKSLVAIWVFYQIARWTEVRIPQATTFALKYAPITFLTFAAHYILFRAFSKAILCFQPELVNSDIILLTPFAVFGIMTGCFFALKRWCPILLHLVAHYKLRPDDIKPQQRS